MGQRFGELKHLPISPATRSYLVRNSSPADSVLASLVERTADIGDLSIMLVPEEEAALLGLLTRMLAAELVVDVGTFTGCSALAFARGLAPGGRVITCDVTDKWLGIAQEHWSRAGVSDRIDFRLGPAEETLRGLAAGSAIDIAFLDADKENYGVYYELIVPLLRSGGLLILDNVLFNGYVLAPELAESGLVREAAAALREVNARLAADPRLEAVMLPIADGLTLARKKVTAGHPDG